MQITNASSAEQNNFYKREYILHNFQGTSKPSTGIIYNKNELLPVGGPGIYEMTAIYRYIYLYGYNGAPLAKKVLVQYAEYPALQEKHEVFIKNDENYDEEDIEKINNIYEFEKYENTNT